MPESNDFDMPRQRTKQYVEVIKPNQTFYKMFDSALSGISEGQYLKNSTGKIISINELKRMVYGKQDNKFTVDNINEILSFLLWLPYIKAKDIVEHIGTPERRSIIWDTDIA